MANARLERKEAESMERKGELDLYLRARDYIMLASETEERREISFGAMDMEGASKLRKVDQRKMRIELLCGTGMEM